MNKTNMFNLFTKSILQDLLESVDDNYKWKKDELIDVLSRFDLHSISVHAHAH